MVNTNLDFDALDGLCGQETVYALATDYAEEDNSDGSIDLGSSDLELMDDGNNQTVGVLFSNVDVAQGASITSAFVQFEADEISTGEITITIQGELSTNASTFSTTTNDVSSRTTTTASESWTPEDWTQLNEAGKSLSKREKVFKNINKDGFLDVLAGSEQKKAAKSSKQPEVKTEVKQEEADESTWKILRDDFMMGAKMKDWDKQSDSE